MFCFVLLTTDGVRAYSIEKRDPDNPFGSSIFETYGVGEGALYDSIIPEVFGKRDASSTSLESSSRDVNVNYSTKRRPLSSGSRSRISKSAAGTGRGATAAGLSGFQASSQNGIDDASKPSEKLFYERSNHVRVEDDTTTANRKLRDGGNNREGRRITDDMKNTGNYNCFIYFCQIPIYN